MASTTDSDIDKFIKNFLEKGLEKENPLDILIKLIVEDKELPNLRRDFKEKYLKPLFKNWTSIIKDLDKNKDKVSDIFNKLESIFDTINKKTTNIPDLTTSKVNEKDNSGDVLKTLTSVYSEKPKKEPLSSEIPNQSSEISNKESIKQPVIEENISKLSDDKISKEKLIEENKPETIISFSTNTNTFLSSLIDRLINKQKETLENLELTAGPTKKTSILDTILDLAKSFPVMLAAVGGATALAGMFWPEIKKFIGEKFGDKAADVFDSFQGTVNAIGKIFTLGGLQLKFAGTFKTVGDFIGKIADDLAKYSTDMFKGMIDNVLGIGVEAGGKVAGSAVGKGLKGTLAKGAGLLLKGVSKTVLKGIPLIGSVISFADAWGRFKEGEYAQGLIDIGAGLAGFVPGIGTGLSIGLSVMNAIIDFKSPEEKKELTQKTFNIAGMLIKGVGVYAKLFGGPLLKRIPFIGSLFNFANAWEKFQENNILGGTLDLASGIAAFVPGVGLPISIGIDILSSFIGTKEAKESGIQKTGFDIAKIATKAISYFAKFGKPFLKRLPLIGSLLSFSSAWDNFQQDNIMAGSLDIVSGIASLFPGVGTGISIGIDILNSFMSSKDEGGKTKFQAVGDWFSKIWKWVKDTPVMKAFFNLYDGIEAVFMGDMPRAFKTLSNIPLIGGMFDSIGKALNLDTKNSPTLDTSKAINLTTSKTQKIIENLPTKYNKEEEEKLSEQGKILISKRKELQKESQDTKEQNSTVIGRDQKIKELDKQIELLMAEQSDLNIQIKRQKELKEGKTFEKSEKQSESSLPEKDTLNSTLQEKVNELKKLQNQRTRDPKRSEKITSLNKEIEELTKRKELTVNNANFASNDNVLPSLFGVDNLKKEGGMIYQPRLDTKNAGSYIINPQERNITTTHPNDKIFASKSGDSVDNTFKTLTESIDDLNKKIESLINLKSFESSKPNIPEKNNQPIIINNNNDNNTQLSGPIKLSGGRDEIYLTRMDWLRNNSYSRL